MVSALIPSSRGDPVHWAFFTERTDDGNSVRLAAATLWRQLSHDPPPPSGFDFDMRGVWTDGVGHGRHQVRYDAHRKIVGILGGQYDLPSNGDMLLLLLEDRSDEEMPAVTVISMPAPVAEGVRNFGGPMTKDEKATAIAQSKRREVTTWTQALRAQADVAAFLARGRSPR